MATVPGPANANAVLLTVHTKSGKAVKVALPQDATVAILKTSIFRTTSIPPVRQSLICRGRVLVDEDPVGDCHGHIVHMHVAGR